jgi:uncharacterized protein with HEPN domain
MLPSTLELLRDILREAEFLESEAQRTNHVAFLGNEVLKRAFVRSVEVIGEAAKQVPEDTRAQFPNVEWKKIVRSCGHLDVPSRSIPSRSPRHGR